MKIIFPKSKRIGVLNMVSEKKKVYKSMAQMEKELFPEIHKRKLKEEKQGTGLPNKILASIKHQLRSN